MGIFARKTMTGYRQVPQTEAACYIEDITEYNETQRQIKAFRHKLQQASEEADRREADCRRTTEEQISSIQYEYEGQLSRLRERIIALESAADEYVQKLRNQENLNANLLRIMRERANAVRGITPKKKYDGYVITACRQYHDHKNLVHNWEEYQQQPAAYKKKNRFIKTERIPVTSWKVSVQTPYSTGIPINQIDAQVLHEMNSGIIKDIGCENIQDQNGPYPLRPDDKCILYRWDYTADLRAGLWTVDLYMTGQPNIPAQRTMNAYTKKEKKT